MPTEGRTRVSLETASDDLLVGRGADGDIHAFEVLMRRHGPVAHVYARRILRSDADADDAVQEAFIAAWRQLPTVSDGTAFRSWIISIVSRKSIDVLRRRRGEAEFADEEYPAAQDSAPHAVAEARSRDEALSRALSTLPPDQERCWILREVAGYSYDDIADQLDLPTSTVRGLLARARKNLIVQMEGWR